MKTPLVFLMFLSLCGFLEGASDIDVLGLNDEGKEFEIVDGDTIPDDQEVTQFGEVLIGEQKTRTYRIVNNGEDILEIFAIKSSFDDYTIDGLELSIPPRGSDDFTISFSPSRSGEIPTTITIESDAPGDLKSYTFALTGFGESAPIPNISVVGLDEGNNTFEITDGDTVPDQEVTKFGEVLLGEENVRHYRIINSGGSPLNIFSIKSSSGDYTIDGLGDSIPPGEPDNFSITFSPNSNGEIPATITIDSNAPGDLKSYTFALTGSGESAPAIPGIVVFGLDEENNAVEIADGDNSPGDQEVVQFGTIIPGEQRVRHYQILNNGGSPLTISSVESTLEDYTFDGLGASIPPGEMDDFTITFSPGGVGKRGARVTIDSNAPGDLASYTFVLSGGGAEVEPPPPSPPSIAGFEINGDDGNFTFMLPDEGEYILFYNQNLDDESDDWDQVPGIGFLSGAAGPLTIENIFTLNGHLPEPAPALFFRLEKNNDDPE